ncbi:cell division protein ZapA [Gammaproteobacteria bacterium]|jgi:cell division protein ZapA (FtsZ GTPase activity inhibitor)|nr:cell division protein ZapA [Gammaproteobacteria bacterium]MDA7786333.1 cell division protein ZapA [Gammaproteobacteria bacterium]MDA7802297.1 cell division protein ZapA [Gammaproteobacteria bacterium]MDA7818606.1 cell division protein ZapA [Gammaproteobacteria bacterium]MDA7856324.1 cell division protein ZapA [Gammaproteobacteria bacterium]|tara:strand:+ start:16058 stop:16312 length:255 start_codon:yes stop_codon:yes gene_type:complete
MGNLETIQLRIFGRDLTLSCPSEEKDQLLKSAQLLNDELDKIQDKQNALVIAGLSLANKALSGTQSHKNSKDLSSLIEKINSVL